MLDQLARKLESDDLNRVTDILGDLKKRIIDVGTPTVADLWERRLIARHLKTRIGQVISSAGSAAEEWKKCERDARLILLENFTRQAREEAYVIGDAGVKHHDYVTPLDATERRTYMGMHTEPFDHEGLSAVVAFKPTLHEQPYHAHKRTDENCLAVHPTTGFAITHNGSPAQITELSPGEMIRFSKGTPHTLKNPTNLLSADVSVKFPTALDDRVGLTHASIGEYLAKNQPNTFQGGKVQPDQLQTAGATIHYRYEVSHSGLIYKIDYLVVPAGEEVTHFDVNGIRRNTSGLMTVFAPLGESFSEISVGGDLKEPKKVSNGSWLVLSDKFSDGVSLSNPGNTDSVVYFARQVR